ncbi:MAG: FIST C-terminal domain-containing protein [Candidatus Krumholzibacteriota bacterium]|nr:FIST C-terminal domain-containing protein [Candidatus Krumholzibacteriota bacterium]
MKIATSWSTSPDTEESIKTAYKLLQSKLGGDPDWMVVYSSVGYDCDRLAACLNRIDPGLSIHGGSSCQGVMTDAGFHSLEGTGLGLFGIKDPSGAYGVGAEDVKASPRDAGRNAIQKAIDAAHRPGEKPQLVWLTCAPGFEEDIIKGIEEVIGSDIPIAGGSSADNTIEGHWKQFINGKGFSNGVVITALYPSTRMHWSFWSGYYATDKMGKVTKSRKRTIMEIDNRSAAEVYNEWTGGAIKESLKGGSVLANTTLYPIGRPLKQMGSLKFYCLSHPESVTPDGGLNIFTDIGENEEIVLMTGSKNRLVDRAGTVAKSALRNGLISSDQVAGGLIIYCAGCMLTIQDDMPKAAANIRETIGGNPFLGAFTFGEQGALVDGANHHGNLMISAVLFESE